MNGDLRLGRRFRFSQMRGKFRKLAAHRRHGFFFGAFRFGLRKDTSLNCGVEHTVAGGPFNGVLWATTKISMPDGITRWRELSATTMAAKGPGRRLSEALAKVKGVPLRTTMTAKMGANEFTTTAEAVEVREVAPAADVLRVPDGFAKVATPKLTDE